MPSIVAQRVISSPGHGPGGSLMTIPSARGASLPRRPATCAWPSTDRWCPGHPGSPNPARSPKTSGPRRTACARVWRPSSSVRGEGEPRALQRPGHRTRSRRSATRRTPNEERGRRFRQTPAQALVAICTTLSCRFGADDGSILAEQRRGLIAPPGGYASWQCLEELVPVPWS